MTSITDIQTEIKPELSLLNERIAQRLHSSNALMNTVIENYLKVKGKQIRPILVMLSARLFGEVNDRVIASAAAVELLHNASLIHDDVVDDTRTRRGVTTINGLWDNHIAVLVGDYFVSTSLQEAISTGDSRAIASIANLGKLLSLGEIDQIYNARYHCLSEEAYLGVISRKTASLFVACVEMGAYAVDADVRYISHLRDFAELLGLCFQIKDDIFDYFDDDKIGKPTGNDLREGKITLPLLHALLENPDSPMCELAMKDQLDEQEILTLINYAKECNGIEYAYDYMKRLYNKACEQLQFLPDGPGREAFDALFRYVISRDS
ncbi:MAG: polyprenyl synthetase family protein [Muribaculaceae bacterium]|nr:polyprenyl synthetase family protein [Muribaculaceae bacterium]